MGLSAVDVTFDSHFMWVDLSDGRKVGVPLAWYPRLRHATPLESKAFEIGRFSLHWKDIGQEIQLSQLIGVAKEEKNKPIGSGLFSFGVGLVLFIAAGLFILIIARTSLIVANKLTGVEVLVGWLILSGVILIGWGVNRIWYQHIVWIGQETINMVIGILAATFAIAAIAFQK
jgi:Protein of unknown function (DUF2442)